MISPSMGEMLRSSTMPIGVASALACALMVTEADARVSAFDEMSSEPSGIRANVTSQDMPEAMMLADHDGGCTCDDDDDDDDYADDYDEDGGDGDALGHGGHSNQQALTSAQERLQRLTNRSVGVRIRQYELGSGRTDGYWGRP